MLCCEELFAPENTPLDAVFYALAGAATRGGKLGIFLISEICF